MPHHHYPHDYPGPHDYYDEEHDYPFKRAMGHPQDYLEPDILGSESDAALPIISTLGAGPQGRGIYAQPWSNPSLGQWGFAIYSDDTNEVLAQSPNLLPGHIAVEQDKHHMVAGEPNILHIHYFRDGNEHIEDIVLNPGSDGTRIYFNPNIVTDWDPDDVSTHTRLLHFSELDKCDPCANHHSLPDPRVDDIVIGFATNKNACYLTIGIIEFSNLDHDPNYDYDAIYVIHTVYPWLLPVVGENGNWFYNGQDLGIKAQGPKGDKGDPGKTPEVSIKGGSWYIDGIDTGWPSQGPRGPEGHTPAVGANGNWYVDGRDTGYSSKGIKGDPGPEGPMPRLTIDPKTGNWLINGEDSGFNARGEDGFAFDLQYNYYVLGKDELPDYDNAPYGYAFVVYDEDPELAENRFDLYYKGRVPVASEDGGPWVVVENWQGRTGYPYVPSVIQDEDGNNVLHWETDSPKQDQPADVPLITSYNDLIDKPETPKINGVEIKESTVFSDIKPSYNDLVDKPELLTMQDIEALFITPEELDDLFENHIKPYIKQREQWQTITPEELDILFESDIKPYIKQIERDSTERN